MLEKTGEVFSIAKDHAPIPGCTISKNIYSEENAITYFSLARHTDISAEIYPYHKLILVADGELEIYSNRTKLLHAGDCLLTEMDEPVGMRSHEGTVYTEISVRRNDKMNEIIKAGEVFQLADLIPYRKGEIVNRDIVHNAKMKFVIMAFDENTGLSKHAAPGEALIFALEGEGIIHYEGADYPIKAGENFHFAKGGLHAVKAIKPFKMALLLTLE